MPERTFYNCYLDNEEGSKVCPVDAEVSGWHAGYMLDVETPFGNDRIKVGPTVSLYLHPDLAGEDYDCLLCHNESWYLAKKSSFIL